MDATETSASGEYWRKGDKVRIRCQQRGEWTEFLQSDGKVTILHRPGQSGASQKPVAEIRPALSGPLGNQDVWFLALALITGPDPGTVVTFDELLNHPHKIHEVKRVTEGGKDLVHVHLSHALSDLEFWFDPAANYLLRKHFISALGQSTVIRSEVEVSGFREVVPAVFFPEAVVSRTFVDTSCAAR